MAETWEGPGDVCTPFGKDRGCDETGGDGGESTGDTERREIVIKYIHGIRKN